MDTISLVRSPVLMVFAVVATVLGGALVLAWLGSQFGGKAALVLPIAAVLLIVFVKPHIGVPLLALLIPLESVIVFGSQATIGVNVTWVRAVALVVFVAWILQKLVTRGSWERALSANILKPALLLVVFISASLLWVENAPAGIVPTLTAVQLLIFSVMVLDTVNSRHRLEWVARFLVLGGVIAALFTIGQTLFSGVPRAGDSISGSVNATAAVMVIPRSCSWTIQSIVDVPSCTSPSRWRRPV